MKRYIAHWIVSGQSRRHGIFHAYTSHEARANAAIAWGISIVDVDVEEV